MKASEVTIAWSKPAGRADGIMREETRQHEGIKWELKFNIHTGWT